MKTREIERGGREEIDSMSEGKIDSIPISPPEKLSYSKDDNK